MSSSDTLTLTPEFGIEESIEFRTLKTEMEDGSMRTRAKRNYGMRKYIVNVLFYSKTAMDALWDFYIARQGRYDPFLIKIYHEYQVTAEAIGTGNGTQTVFVLDEFPVDTAASTNTFYSNDVEKAATVTNNLSGEYSLVTFDAAPGNGEAITGDYEIYFYMRFAKDIMKRELFHHDLLNAGIELIEAAWIDYRPRSSNTNLMVVSVSDSISIDDEDDSIYGAGDVSVSDSISITSILSNSVIARGFLTSDSITIAESQTLLMQLLVNTNDSISITSILSDNEGLSLSINVNESISISTIVATPTKQILFAKPVGIPFYSSAQWATGILGASPLNSWSSGDVYRSVVVPTDGTLSNLNIICYAAPGSSKSARLVVVKDFVETALEVTISDLETSGTDLTHSISVSAGDEIWMELEPTNDPLNTMYPRWNLTFKPDIPDQTILLGNSASPVIGSPYYGSLNGICLDAPTSTGRSMIFPVSGTLKNLYLKTRNDPGEGNTYVASIYKIGVGVTSLVATVTSGNIIANDLTNTVDVAAGDIYVMELTYTGSPALEPISRWGTVFVPDDPKTFILNITTSTIHDSSATRYYSIQGALLAQEYISTGISISPKMRFTRMQISINVAPGEGKSWIYTLRKNSTDTAITVTISDTNTTGYIDADVDITENDLLSMKQDPVNTPANSSLTVKIALAGKVLEIQ